MHKNIKRAIEIKGKSILIIKQINFELTKMYSTGKYYYSEPNIKNFIAKGENIPEQTVISPEVDEDIPEEGKSPINSSMAECYGLKFNNKFAPENGDSDLLFSFVKDESASVSNEIGRAHV